MKSKISYFNISSAIIREDFRKFWAVPLLAFIAYFLESIFFIIVEYSDFSMNVNSGELARFVETLLTGQNIIVELNLIWVPILSTLLIFSYLHNSGSVMSVHSQPFTRSMLINSHAVSSFLFAVLPILATGVILLIMSKPLYYESDYYSSAKEMINVFSRTEVLLWIWESVLTTSFVLVIAILAGMVTGTVLHHAIAAFGFNAVVPICVGLVDTYFKEYLFGYMTGEWLINAIYYMSPVISGMEVQHFSLFVNIVYIFVIMLIYVFASFLYHKRKLERVTDGIVFKTFDVAITYIFGFLGMSLLGMVFRALFDRNQFITAIGYIVGALLGIVICRMIIMKTIRIFSKKSVIIMSSYAVVALAFFGGIFVIGNICYNNFVPSEDRVNSVYLEIDGGYINDIINMSDGVKLKEKESIEAVMDYHRMIIDNRDIIDEESNYSYRLNMIEIAYMDKNDKIFMKRSYEVPMSLVSFSEEEKNIINLKEVKEYQLDFLNPDNIKAVELSFPYYMLGGDSTTTLTASEADELIVAFKKDLNKRNPGSMYEGHSIVMANIGISLIDAVSEYGETDSPEYVRVADYIGYTTFNVYKTDVETMKWMSKYGYDKYLHVANEWDGALILPPGTDYSEIDINPLPLENPDFKFVEDQEKIKNLYTESYNYDGSEKIPDISKNYPVVIFLFNEDNKYYVDAVGYLPKNIEDILD